MTNISTSEKYKQNAVMTSSPEELTLMLYNGAVKFITLSKMMIEQNDMEKTHNSIMRSQAIISELNITLDMKYEISKNLRQLYIFILEKLTEANIKKETKPLDEILPLVKDLRDTWKEAIKNYKVAKKATSR